MPREQPSSVLFPTYRDRVKVENSLKRKSKKRVQQESILEHFDKIARAHLEEHSRESCALSSRSSEIKVQKESVSAIASPGSQRPLNFIARGMVNSISNIDIIEQVNNSCVRNELLEAVDKLVRAEQVDKFPQILAAAEAAVAAVPPELAEEAALAVVHDYYRTHSVTTIKEEILGDTIIEVLGYIGIRRKKKSAE